MADKLENMLELQKRLSKLIQEKNITEITNTDISSCIMQEAFKLREEFGFKPWKHEPREYNRSKVLELYADLLHYVLELAISLKLDADGIEKVYISKNINNVLELRHE